MIFPCTWVTLCLPLYFYTWVHLSLSLPPSLFCIWVHLCSIYCCSWVVRSLCILLSLGCSMSLFCISISPLLLLHVSSYSCIRVSLSMYICLPFTFYSALSFHTPASLAISLSLPPPSSLPPLYVCLPPSPSLLHPGMSGIGCSVLVAT